MQTYAPIALFAFNRPEHLQRTVDALAANELARESDLTVFCDGPRNKDEREKTDAVRAVAREIQGFSSVTIIEREKNLGCANAFITGLTEMFARFDRLVVIEDDILCSKQTLAFLNSGLDKYESYKTVFNIDAWAPPPAIFSIPSGYPYDVFAIPRFNCWGWASWRDRFELIDWNMGDYKIFQNNSHLQKAYDMGGTDLNHMLKLQMAGDLDTWDIQLDYTRFKYGCVSIAPVKSYTTNIGMGCGTHTTSFTTHFDNDTDLACAVDEKFRWMTHVYVDNNLRKSFFNAHVGKSFFKDLINKIFSLKAYFCKK